MQYFRELDKYTDLVGDDLKSLKLDDVEVYPLMRRGLTLKYLVRKKIINTSNHKRYSLSDFVLILLGAFLSFFSLFSLLLGGTKKFVFMGFSRRSLTPSGESLDKFHDPIIELLDSSDCIMIERPFRFTHSRNKMTKCPVINYDFVVYLSYVLGFVYRIYCKFFRGDKINIIASKINSKFDFNIVSTNSIAMVVGVFKAERFIAKFIIKKLKPEKLIVTSRWLHYGFLSVAKERGLEIIELQHGSILKSNIFYQSLDEGDLSPNTMFTFSEYWNDRDWNAPNVIAIGNGSLEADVKERCVKDNRVLVISQPEMQSKLISDLKSLSKVNSHSEFYVKLHPQDVDEYESRYSELLDCNNINFISNNKESLKELLLNYRLVVGYNSTVLFEAYDIGLSVGLLSSEEIPWNDYVKYLGDACELFENIEVDSVIDFGRFIRSDFSPVFYKPLDKKFVRRYFYEENV